MVPVRFLSCSYVCIGWSELEIFKNTDQNASFIRQRFHTNELKDCTHCLIWRCSWLIFSTRYPFISFAIWTMVPNYLLWSSIHTFLLTFILKSSQAFNQDADFNVEIFLVTLTPVAYYRDNMKPVHAKHHWLENRARAAFRIIIAVFSIRLTRQPSYFTELIKDYVPSHVLRSTTFRHRYWRNLGLHRSPARELFVILQRKHGTPCQTISDSSILSEQK